MSKKSSYYHIIPSSIMFDENLNPSEKLLYGQLTSLCNEKGFCWATNNYLAKKNKVSKSTVSRWISNLVKNKYIRLEIIYKDNSQEILCRKIYLNDPTFKFKNC